MALYIPTKTVSVLARGNHVILHLLQRAFSSNAINRRRGRVDEADLLAEKINLVIARVQNHLLNILSKSSPKQMWAAVILVLVFMFSS